MRSRAHHREIPSATKSGLLTFEHDGGPAAALRVFGDSRFLFLMEGQLARCFCQQARELQPQCLLTTKGAAKHIHGGRQTQRTELFHGFAYRYGCGPSPPSSHPSLLRPGALNVPCFLACTGPSHPIPHCSQLLRFSVLLPQSWKIGRGKVPTESTPTSSDEQSGQVVASFLGKRSIGRKPFQKKKTSPGSEIVFKFLGLACVQP